MLECAGNPAWLLGALAFLNPNMLSAPHLGCTTLHLLGSRSYQKVPSQTISGLLNFSPKSILCFPGILPSAQGWDEASSLPWNGKAPSFQTGGLRFCSPIPGWPATKEAHRGCCFLTTGPKMAHQHSPSYACDIPP